MRYINSKSAIITILIIFINATSASDLIEKNISYNSHIELDGITFNEDLDLSKIQNYDNNTKEENGTFPGSLIRISNSRVNGNLTFENIQFPCKVDLENTTINGSANFRQAHFKDSVAFRSTKFLGNVFFSEAKFDNGASFESSQFKKSSYFYGLEAMKYMDFHGAQFWGYADFKDAKFFKNANFKNTIFRDNSEFHRSRFVEMSDFNGAEFLRLIKFNQSSFEGDSHFCKARFSDNAIFDGANFERNAYFGREAGAPNGAVFNKSLILDNSIVHNLYLEKIILIKSSKISLKNCEFNQIIVDWVDISEHIGDYSPTYLKLIRNFNSLEQFQDATDCYYQYMRLSQDKKGWGVSKLIDIILWLSCGYGVKLHHTIICILFFIILFGMFYFFNTVYVFNWDGIPGADEGKLIDFLAKRHDIKYVKNAEIKKINNGKVIKVSINGKPFLLKIDKENKVKYEIDNGKTIRFIAKTENNNRNIYNRLYPTDALYISAMIFTGDSPKPAPSGKYKFLVILERFLGWLLLATFLLTLWNISLHWG